MKTKLKTTFGRMKTKLAQICGKQQMLCVCDKSVNAKAFVSRKNFSHQKNVATVHSHASQCDRFNLNSVCMEEKHVTTWILADPTETKSNGVDFEIDWKIGICIRIIFFVVGWFIWIAIFICRIHTHTYTRTHNIKMSLHAMVGKAHSPKSISVVISFTSLRTLWQM